jgi:hypothetical protein
VTEQPCVGFDSSTSAGLPEVIPLGLLPGCTYGPGEKIDMGMCDFAALSECGC